MSARRRGGAQLWEVAFGGERFAVLEVGVIAYPAKLTATEREILEALASGRSPAEIARARGRRLTTVNNQIASAYRKLGAGSRAEALARLRAR